RFTKKIAGQLAISISQPPASGPAARPKPETPDQMPIACVRSRGSGKAAASTERLPGASAAARIGIKLRQPPASSSCGAAWTTPTLCLLASADVDRGAAPSGTADACLPASVLPPAVVPYWETVCVSRCDSLSAYCAGSL